MIKLLVASLLTPSKNKKKINVITRCKINYARNIKHDKNVGASEISTIGFECCYILVPSTPKIGTLGSRVTISSMDIQIKNR